MTDSKEIPFLIELPAIGASTSGYLAVAENNLQVPFEVKRVYWTFQTPEFIVRGRHAHYQTEQILIAVTGRILVNTEQTNGVIQVFVLDKPNVGLYIPPQVWHTMQYSSDAVQLVLASTDYEEEDYIRDYTTFKALCP